MKLGRKEASNVKTLANYSFWIIIIPIFVVSIIVPFLRWDKIRTTLAKESVEQLNWEIEQKKNEILNIPDEKQRASLKQNHYYGDAMREWLNEKVEIQEAGIHCVSVKLHADNESLHTYHGIATFSNDEEVNVEVGRETESGELYLKANLPFVASIPATTFPGYDYITIRKAFETFFAKPKWALRISDNGAKMVEFSGLLKEDLLLIEIGDDPFGNTDDVFRLAYGVTPSWLWKKGEQVSIRFVISIDGESFEFWSVQRGEDPPTRANDWEKQAMIGKLFEVIYELK